MRRDRAVQVLLGLLLLLVLRSSGLADTGWGPATPDAFLAVAVVLTAFFVLVVGPSLQGAGPGRPLALLVVAVPFLAYGVLESPTLAGVRSVPAPAFWVLVGVGVLLSRVGRRGGAALVAVLLTVLAGGGLLGLLPAAADLVRRPTAWMGGPPEAVLAERADARERIGPKRGAPVPVETSDLASGAGPFLEPATRGRFPPGADLRLVFGLDGDLAARGEGYVPGDEVRGIVSAVELDVYDAAIVLPGAWGDEDPDAPRIAAALATFARRGGVLVGPAPGRAWPAPLGQELGAAGRGWATGMAGGQPFGLGLVVRADSEPAIRSVVAAAAGRARVPVGTVFDDPDAAAPPLPGGLERWADRPADRRSQGVLLAVYVAVAVLLDLILRGAVPRVMGMVAPALALALGLAWTSPAAAGVRAHALAFELGGGGGRRLDAVALSAGPVGWIGPCRYEAGGFVRLVGAHLGPDGQVRVGPGRTGWVLRETVARGLGGLEPESRRAGFLRSLLRGEVDAGRLRFGRGAAPDVEVGGRGVAQTWVVRWR